MAILEEQGSIDANDPVQSDDRPLLYDGQRLDQPTFHQLYLQTPEDFRVELIDGVVSLMNMPLYEDHGCPDAELNGVLFLYTMDTPGTIVQGKTTIILDPSDEVQPDSALKIDPAWGGQTARDSRGATIGCPELVVEIASSSLGIDLNTKKNLYERAGALEYIVFDVLHQKFHWFARIEGRFQRLPRETDGIYRSRAFPGLWINEPAFIQGDKRAVFLAIRSGTTSPEHAEFVERLRQNRANRP
jgi:Uma2 family endonuclease